LVQERRLAGHERHARTAGGLRELLVGPFLRAMLDRQDGHMGGVSLAAQGPHGGANAVGQPCEFGHKDQWFFDGRQRGQFRQVSYGLDPVAQVAQTVDQLIADQQILVEDERQRRRHVKTLEQTGGPCKGFPGDPAGPDATQPMHAANEAELIARCRRGDAAAWTELCEQHYDAVGHFVFQFSPDFSREDVEEICQEVFLSVVRRFDSFHGASAFQTWLFRVAVNKCHDFRERRLAAKRGGGRTIMSLQEESPDTGLTLDPPGALAGPDEVLMTREQMNLLRKALDQLSDPCREIIELRYFGDRSYEELAFTLKLNPKTVSSRLSKCLDRLEEIARRVFAAENSQPFSV